MKTLAASFLACFLIFTTACSTSLQVNRVAASGHYAVITRDIGSIRFEHASSDVRNTDNVFFDVLVPHGVSSEIASALTDALDLRGSYVHVPVGLSVAYDRSAVLANSQVDLLRPSEKWKVSTPDAEFQAQLPQLAEQNNLDFIIVISEWATRAEVEELERRFVGYGVQFRDDYAWRRLDAYAVYQLQLYDAKSGHSSFRTVFGVKPLSASRWIDLKRPGSPTVDQATAFQADIVDAARLDLRFQLCRMGLMQLPQQTSGEQLWQRCRDSYQGKD